MIISYQKIGYRRKLVLVLFISIILVMLTKINIKEGLHRDNAPILFVECADYTEGAFDLNDEAEDIYEGLDGILPEGLDSTEDVLDLSLFGELILGTVSDRARGCGGFLITLVGVALLLSLAERGIFDRGLEATSSAALSGVLSIPIFSSLYSLVGECATAVNSGCEFFSGLLPLMISVTALEGGAVSSAVQGAGMSLALSFISGVILNGLLPVVSLSFSLALLSSFDKEGIIGSLSSLIRGFILSVMGIVGMLLPATLAMQSLLASAKDTLALRSAKYAVGSMIPIVGGTVAGALSTLSAGAGVLRSAVGGVGAMCIIYIFLSPVLVLLLYRGCIGLSLTLLDFCGVRTGGRMLKALLSAYDALLALIACAGVVFLLETVIFTRTVISL